MELFSTRGLPASRKISFWNEISSETFARMEVRPRDLSRFDGTLRRKNLGPLSVIDVSSAAVRIQHTRAHINAEPMPSYLLLAPVRREFELSTDRARALKVRAGEWCLLDHASPYTLVHGDGVRVLCLDIPRDGLEQRLYGAQRVVGRVARPECATSRMLLALLDSLAIELAGNAGAELSAALGLRLLDFVATAYAAHSPQGHVRRALARAEGICAFIDTRLADSELTPSEVAAHFGISDRHLRGVLKQSGESFSEYLLRRRLERSASLLRDPSASDVTITQVAFQTGFNNLTHFGYAFKQRYEQTPREYRATHQVAPERDPRGRWRALPNERAQSVGVRL